MAEKKKLSAKAVLQDIKVGMSHEGLMTKYGLSPAGLQKLFDKMVEAGLLAQTEVDSRVASRAAASGFAQVVSEVGTPLETNPAPGADGHKDVLGFKWLCPACQTPHHEKYAVCPQCGIIVEKYEAKLGRERESGAAGVSSLPGSLSPQNSAEVPPFPPAPSGAGLPPLPPEAYAAPLPPLPDQNGSSFPRQNQNEPRGKGSAPGELGRRPLSDIKPFYLSVFRDLEEGKRAIRWQLIVLVVLFGEFWYFFKGMWRKGLVLAGITFTFSTWLNIAFPNLNPVISVIMYELLFVPVALFVAPWDYYLYRMHGQAFYTRHWLFCIPGRHPEDLYRSLLLAPETTDGIPQLPEDTERSDKKKGYILTPLVLAIMFIVGVGVDFVTEHKSSRQGIAPPEARLSQGSGQQPAHSPVRRSASNNGKSGRSDDEVLPAVGTGHGAMESVVGPFEAFINPHNKRLSMDRNALWTRFRGQWFFGVSYVEEITHADSGRERVTVSSTHFDDGLSLKCFVHLHVSDPWRRVARKLKKGDLVSYCGRLMSRPTPTTGIVLEQAEVGEPQ